MARTYAGIMALIGLLVVLLRALKDGAGFDGTIINGLVWMTVLGFIGMIVGSIAQDTVQESVRKRIEGELASLNAGSNSKETTAGQSQLSS